MQRRLLVTGGLWLCGLAAGFLISKPLAVALGVLGLLALLGAWEPVATQLPTLSIAHVEGALTVQIRAPQRRGRRRLRREVRSLALDIHAYVQSLPADVFDQRAWHKMIEAQGAVKDEQERNRIWNEYTVQSSERSAREAQDLKQRFGGRMSYVISEFQRRGMLTDVEASKLEWETNSCHWIVRAANEIEGLAHRL